MGKEKTRATVNANEWETLGPTFTVNGQKRRDSFCRVFDSLLLSDAFKDLSPRQKVLLISMTSQRFGHRKPERVYPDNPSVHGEAFFFFSWRDAQLYGLYPASCSSAFYKDMNVLIEHGFIKKTVSGKATHTRNILEFIPDWKNWNPP